MKEPKTLCVIRWQDACKRDGNFTKDEIGGEKNGYRFDRVELYTVGWLVHESEDTLTLATDYRPDEDHWRDLLHVPKGMIQSVRKYPYPPKTELKRRRARARK